MVCHSYLLWNKILFTRGACQVCFCTFKYLFYTQVTEYSMIQAFIILSVALIFNKGVKYRPLDIKLTVQFHNHFSHFCFSFMMECA
jgi:hypothetical protein